MAEHPGHLWGVVQDWLDTFRYRPPSQNELAPRFGVSSSSLTDYKYARTMPPPEFVVRVAIELQVPFEKVLNAVLEDHGYAGESLKFVRRQVEHEIAEGIDPVQMRASRKNTKRPPQGPRVQRGD